MWNGRDDDPVAVSITCGSYTRVPGLAPNFVVLDLPTETAAAADSWCRLRNARRLMVATIDCWEPDWAVITSHGLRQVHQQKAGQPFIGWISYFARWQPPRDLPTGIAVEPAGKNGAMISLAVDCTDVDSERARLATAALKPKLS